MMNCPKCQTANPENAKFCMNCGAALSIACPICATINPPSAKFCFNCGSSLGNKTESPAITQPSPLQDQNRSKLEGERRIVTVLFCDVTGSTSMAEGFDPEEWASIMNRAFQYLIAPIAKYQGTVARLMGDAILAFFGAPNAHEDDPQRAILAGLDILEGIRGFHQELKNQYALDFNVRVGINTGLVMVGNIGTQERMEYTAMGDAVNLAARMEQTAQPGTIQIAEDTYRLVASLFDFQPLSRIEIKGKKEPVQAYRVLGKREGVTPKRGIQGLHSPLVGRSIEFSRLQDLLEKLMAGQGAIVSLIGEAGLGKSRLMAEIHHWVEAQGWLESMGNFPQIGWYEGRSLSYEVNFPYTPFIDILNSIFSFPTKEDEKHPYTQIFMTEYEQAWQTAQHSLEISRQIGNLELQAEILSQAIPLYHMRAGDYLSAYQSAEEGAQIAHRIGAAFPECMGAYLAGKLSQEMGDYERAIAWEEEAFQAGEVYGIPFLGAMSLCTLGAIYQEINAQKFKEKITASHQRALEMIELPGGMMAGGTGWFDLGMCALNLGDEARAVEFFQKGLDIPTPQMFIMRSYYWVGLALCSLVRGNTDEAETFLQKAGQYSVEKKMNHVLPLLEFVQGKIFLAKGETEKALESFQKAEAKAESMVMRPLIRQIRANMAIVPDQLGRTDEAARFRNLENQMTAEIASLFHDDALRQAFSAQTTHGEPV